MAHVPLSPACPLCPPPPPLQQSHPECAGRDGRARPGCGGLPRCRGGRGRAARLLQLDEPAATLLGEQRAGGGGGGLSCGCDMCDIHRQAGNGHLLLLWGLEGLRTSFMAICVNFDPHVKTMRLITILSKHPPKQAVTRSRSTTRTVANLRSPRPCSLPPTSSAPSSSFLAAPGPRRASVPGPPAPAPGGGRTLMIRMMNASVEYGFEYLGNRWGACRQLGSLTDSEGLVDCP